MFIWDFVVDTVLGDVMDWLYSQLIGFYGSFFAQMGQLGAELFEMPWVQEIIRFFLYLAWALFVTGLVVSVFECAIEYQSGRSSLRDAALNAVKGFLAVGLFSTVPVELYQLSVSLQSSFAANLTGFGSGMGTLASRIIDDLQAAGGLESAGSSGVFGGLTDRNSVLMILFVLLLMGYAVIKVFFANLKRGGILLIQIAVGSLYMFSVPRGYMDGFVGWCKQIIGLCLTAFLQSIFLIAGLMVVREHALLGLGLMLAAGEIPRIAGAFGLDTSTKASLASAVHTAQSAVHLTRMIKTVAVK